MIDFIHILSDLFRMYMHVYILNCKTKPVPWQLNIVQ